MSSDSATESDADTATCSSSLSDGSSSSSDDETHVRVHWGRVEVSTEGRFLHKVRRRDSREFHRRKTMGPDADDWCKDRIPRGVGDDGHNEESEEPKQGPVSPSRRMSSTRFAVPLSPTLRSTSSPFLPQSPLGSTAQAPFEAVDTSSSQASNGPHSSAVPSSPAPIYSLPSFARQSGLPSAEDVDDEDEDEDASFMYFAPRLDVGGHGVNIDDSYDEEVDEEDAWEELIDTDVDEDEESGDPPDALPLREPLVALATSHMSSTALLDGQGGDDLPSESLPEELQGESSSLASNQVIAFDPALSELTDDSATSLDGPAYRGEESQAALSSTTLSSSPASEDSHDAPASSLATPPFAPKVFSDVTETVGQAFYLPADASSTEGCLVVDVEVPVYSPAEEVGGINQEEATPPVIPETTDASSLSSVDDSEVIETKAIVKEIGNPFKLASAQSSVSLETQDAIVEGEGPLLIDLDGTEATPIDDEVSAPKVAAPPFSFLESTPPRLALDAGTAPFPVSLTPSGTPVYFLDHGSSTPSTASTPVRAKTTVHVALATPPAPSADTIVPPQTNSKMQQETISIDLPTSDEDVGSASFATEVSEVEHSRSFGHRLRNAAPSTPSSLRKVAGTSTSTLVPVPTPRSASQATPLPRSHLALQDGAAGRPASKVLRREAAAPSSKPPITEKEMERLVRKQLKAAVLGKRIASSPAKRPTSPARPWDAGRVPLSAPHTASSQRSQPKMVPLPTLARSQVSSSLDAPLSTVKSTPLPMTCPLVPASASKAPISVSKQLLHSQSTSRPIPSSVQRPVFSQRAAPPQASSLRPPSALPSSTLSVTSASSKVPAIPKLASSLPKPVSSRIASHSSALPRPAGSKAAAVASIPSTRKASSVSSKVSATSFTPAAGFHTSALTKPRLVGVLSGGGGSRAEATETSFKAESPRSAMAMGKPVRVTSPAKLRPLGLMSSGSSLYSGPVRMQSPVKGLSASYFSSSFGPPSLTSSSLTSSISARTYSFNANASIFARPTASPAPPSPAFGIRYASVGSTSAMTVPAEPIVLRNGKQASSPKATAQTAPSTADARDSSPPSSDISSLLPMSSPSRPEAERSSESPSLSETAARPPSPPTKEPSPPPSKSTKSTKSSDEAPVSTTTTTTPSGRSLRARKPPAAPESNSSGTLPDPSTAPTGRATSTAQAAKRSNAKTRAGDAAAAAATAAGGPDDLSAAQLKSLTLMNTTKNQVYFCALEKVVVRKTGEMRPTSPDASLRKSGSSWAASQAQAKRERDDEDDEEETTRPEKHIRGPGETEDFESPVKNGSGGRAGRKSKEAKGGEEKKTVKWDKGLVWIPPREEAAPAGREEKPENDKEGTTTLTQWTRRSRKSCLAREIELDALGNLLPGASPLSKQLERLRVTYTKLVYDDDKEARTIKGKKK